MLGLSTCCFLVLGRPFTFWTFQLREKLSQVNGLSGHTMRGFAPSVDGGTEKSEAYLTGRADNC